MTPRKHPARNANQTSLEDDHTPSALASALGQVAIVTGLAVIAAWLVVAAVLAVLAGA